ncbi:MAG TPA: DJ-1/PfpI family protein [Longimicrobiales bacterium]|nr:DJ-1/PfpI family protein [Longimicrobiales bacterium]
MSTNRTVGILLFDDVEVLDFAGPFEVFSVTGRRNGSDPFDVFTVAETQRPIAARNQLIVSPRYSFADCPHIDVLVVPGGFGTRREMRNDKVLDFVKTRTERAELVLSVCTGALILGRAGLLDGLPATTHHGAVELLKEIAPAARVQGDRRVIDNGKIVVAAGVSSGIDAAFYVVSRLLGHEVAAETAHYIEYPLPPNA